MVLSCMSRLLQTAHSNELYIGPQKTRYHVWIFFKPEDLPGDERRSERMRPRRKRSRLSYPSALSKSSNDDKEPEEERSSQRCKNRRNNAKVLTKIRSRISSVKSRSVPVVRPAFLSGGSRCRKQRSARRLEDMEEAKPEEEARLLSEYATRSGSILKKDRSSIFSLLSNDSTANLPPPPPPFALTLENEELHAVENVPSKSSGTRTKFSQPLSESIITSQNSGRRAKVLEKFGEIRECCDKSTQHRESGGADIQRRFSSTDVYDRFRGTLQHTLARREAVRARLESARVHNPGYSQKKLDAGRSNALARIKCDNVPPSYRLLADFQLQQRVPPIPSFLLAPAPPPPPLPFSPPNPVERSRNSARICGTKAVSPREQRQCSICNRPVVQSPGSSRESLVEACKDARTLSSSARRKARATFTRHSQFLRGDYVPWNRSTPVSKSVQRG